LAEVQTESSATKIALSWNGASDVSVTVMRKTLCDVDPYITLASLQPGVSSYTDLTVTMNFVYWYKLSAVDAAGDTAEVAIDIQADPPPGAMGCDGDEPPVPSGVNGLECSGSDAGS
jgi:hypothetical protein